ncbi:terpenoid synthase [Penicillium antarcticum]|uniref:terpenoid synthase n=1 Tax=Penicillium antarcticum TaxID=416450 RepID=UPI002393A4F3|nr:terpenoid synthase [Penicillium antarcticum]KAJ5320180.1 terpenoid synthase [Penicillium antarcticum]
MGPIEYYRSMPSRNLAAIIINALNLWLKAPEASIIQISKIMHTRSTRVVNGEARVVNGEARVVNGEARVVNGEARVVNGEARVVNGEEAG